MLAPAMAESRTEQPTARKRERARARGLAASSGDLCAAAALLGLAAGLLAGGGRLLDALRTLVRAGLSAAALPDATAQPLALLSGPLREVGLWLLLPLLAAATCAALAGFVQVGPLFALAAIAPDPGRLDPGERLRALFSAERALELAWTAIKVCALLVVALATLAPSARGVLALGQGSPARALQALAALLGDFGLRMGIALAVIGLLDLALRRAQHARALRMGRSELRDELRESHGIPEQREHRRRLQQELLAQAAASGLERARLLLLDGTGRALALAFDRDDPAQHAPRLVAKGQGAIALRMQAWAEQHALPARLEPGLTAVLYRLELTEQVPSEHYPVLAELFAELDGARP